MSVAVLALAAHVVVWHAYRAEEQKALEHAAQVYTQRHPDVVIEPVAIPFDAFSPKLEAAIPRGNGPDLFIGSHEHIGEWSRSGLLEPIDGKVDAGELGAFLDGTVEPLHASAHLYGLPLTFKSLALFYRKDRIAQPPSDTDELFALARAARASGRYALAYESGAMFYHAAILHGFGGRILDDARPQLDSPESVAALEFVRKLADEHLLPEESTNTVAAQLFNDGHAAMTINGPWFVGEIAAGVPWAVAPLPVVKATGVRMRPLLTIEATMLAARAHEPERALAFARWLAGPEGATLRAVEGHQTVAARAAWDVPAVKDNPVLAAFRAQLPDTVPMSNRPEMTAVWEPANQALRRVLRGAADPRAALAEAERQILETLRPAPPAAPGTPYAVGFGLVALAGGGLAFRRARARGGLGEMRRQGWAYAYLTPALVAMGLLVFVPFAVGAVMSLYHHESGRWTFIGLTNFTDILASREQPIWAPLSFYFTLVVTALWTVANVSLHVLIGATLALLLRDPMLKLRGVYRMLLIIPWAVPNYITALIWKGMFHRQFGAVNGLLVTLGLQPISWFSKFWTAFCANLATNVWLGFPFMMVVTLGALGRIPKELEEAAALDGATRWQRLRHVTLPLLWPAMLPSVLLGAVWTFNMFNIVFLVSGGEPDGATEILVSQAYRWAFTRGHRYGYAAAYAVLIFVVLAVQTALARRATETEAA
jgi:arabinogalactan oligomer/maltooligosaccharide transport system permease protein